MHPQGAFLGINRVCENPHFLTTSRPDRFSQVFEPQAETPNRHPPPIFFLKIIHTTTAKTVASLQILGKV
jgi:hypothetical protein